MVFSVHTPTRALFGLGVHTRALFGLILLHQCTTHASINFNDGLGKPLINSIDTRIIVQINILYLSRVSSKVTQVLLD